MDSVRFGSQLEADQSTELSAFDTQRARKRWSICYRSSREIVPTPVAFYRLVDSIR